MSETMEEKIIISEAYAKVWELMITQAIRFSKGQEITDLIHHLSGSEYFRRKTQEIKLAREYIRSVNFEIDCDFINWDYEAIREKLYRQWEELDHPTAPKVISANVSQFRLDFWREKVIA